MEDLQVKVKPMESLEGEAFFPRYRRLIAFKTALTDPMEATPRDVDAAYEFLKDHITDPEKEGDKVALLNELSAEQIGELFEQISGAKTVPPQNGGPSEDTSD